MGFVPASPMASSAPVNAVVDVVTSRAAHGTALAPTGHSAKDQARIACEQDVRPEPKAFHDARPESLEKNIGLLDNPMHEVDCAFTLQIKGQRALAARKKLVARLERQPEITLARAVDAQDICAQVREQHSAEWHRADRRHLDNTQTLQRAAHFLPFSGHAAYPYILG